MATLSAKIYFLAVLILHGVFLVAGDINTINTSCAGTPYPDFCRSVLARYSEDEPGSTQEVAYLVAQAAYRIGTDAYSHGLYLVPDLQGGEKTCTTDCYQELKKPVDDLFDATGKYPDYDAVVAEVRRSLALAKKNYVEWNCERCRKAEFKTKVDLLSKGNDLGKIMAILSALVNK